MKCPVQALALSLPPPPSGYKLGSHQLLLSAHPATRRNQRVHCTSRAFGFKHGTPNSPMSNHLSTPKASILQPQCCPQRLRPWPSRHWPWASVGGGGKGRVSGSGLPPHQACCSPPPECAPRAAHGLSEATSWQNSDRETDRQGLGGTLAIISFLSLSAFLCVSVCILFLFSEKFLLREKRPARFRQILQGVQHGSSMHFPRWLKPHV